MSKWLLYIGSWWLTFNAWSQSKDSVRTFVLIDVVVYEDLLKSSEIGLTEIEIDSLTLQQATGTNLSDLLRNNAAGQIRSYGTNGLTSPSFRGTGASHTSILWNGINLQNSLTGSSDLSLYPSSFADEVSLQKGGTSSLYGSGAIGGSIQLNNLSTFNQGLAVETQQKIGSFGNFYQSYAVDYSNEAFNSSTQFFHRKLDNDYSYKNQYQNPPVQDTRKNAGANQWGVLQQNDWKINDQSLIGIKLWYQNNDIEIPNSIIANEDTEAVQNDEFIRGLFTWNYYLENLSIVYKQAILWHALTFQPTNGLPSNSTLLTSINRLEMDFYLSSNHSLIGGLNFNFDQAKVDNFMGEPTRKSTAIFASFKSNWVYDKFLTALSFRQELVDGDLVPFSPSFGLEYQPFSKFWIQGNVSRNYRLPTLNDLYWIGNGAIGNPDLKPETSFNYEGGLTYDFIQKPSKFDFSLSATYYHYLVDDWMQWKETDGIWTPINIKQVKSEGIESKFSMQLDWDSFSMLFDAIYNYTSTTNQQVYSDNPSLEIDKQLVYTPSHEASFNLKLKFKKSVLTLNHTYTGLQYSGVENSYREVFEPYQISNIYFNQNVIWKKINFSLQAEINNLLDVDYENRRGYPMYGRNYSIGLAIKFQNKN
ncbi:MAG: TonB-dependent receptor [Reichenbachiella sp.]